MSLPEIHLHPPSSAIYGVRGLIGKAKVLKNDKLRQGQHWQCPAKAGVCQVVLWVTDIEIWKTMQAAPRPRWIA